MLMWLIILALVVAVSVSAVVYLIRKFRRFSFLDKLKDKPPKLSWAAAAAPVVLINLLASIFMNVWAAVIIMIHLFVFWLVCDGFGKLIRKLTKKTSAHYYEGCAAIVFTAVYLSIGWYLAHHVYRTSYSFTTDKKLGQDTLRIVEIADLHVGITLDGSEFAEQCKRMRDDKPDVVIVAGDFVDDSSTKSDMEEACRALKSIAPKYGVYFATGNHDKGYSSGRGYSIDDLRSELKKNGVIILEDESVLVNNSFYIIGRLDRSYDERLSIKELIQDLDTSKYMIVADHQPNDYDNEADAGVDLVLSGHTHGGHIFPAGIIGVLIKANDRAYGTESRGSTDFVVTSGISGWAIPFKTGTISEYVVIDVKEQ